MRMLIALTMVVTSLGAALHAAEPAGRGKIRVLLTFGGHDFEQENVPRFHL